MKIPGHIIWGTDLVKTYIVFLGLIVTQTVCFAQAKSGENSKRTWTAAYMRTLEPDGKDSRLELDGVTQERFHLLGDFVLARQVEGSIPQLVIQGHFDKQGGFAANVSLEVSDQDDGKWKIVESSFSDKVDVTLMGAPHVDRLFTRIELDAFQPYIGKFKFCKVTLQTGQSDVFPMMWLTERGPR
jgi:hypothetical protein